jgi:uncharacterized membrane-anchored protein
MNQAASLHKLPALTLVFWIMKVLATTLGETAGDVLSLSMDLGYLLSTFIFTGIFIIFVTIQMQAKKFHPFLYWSAMIATTTLGTTLSDFATRSMGVGYTGGSLLLFVLLLVSLAVWHKTTGSISVNAVNSAKTEQFYWLAIIFSQTLGTALGDWTADTAALGYLGAAIIFGAILLTVILAHYFTNLPKTVLFWTAFIVTRPLGAVLGDLLDKPIADGGLAFSRYSASAVLLTAMLVCILFFPQRTAKVSHH